jgi:steroid 5-alpha reductase family enzyme
MDPLPWHIFTLPYFFELIGALSVMVGALWFVHLRVGNASWADVGFCLGFGFVVVVCGMAGEGSFWRRALMMGMGSAYAFRLGWHLFRSRVWKKTEDPRYGKLRVVLGKWELLGFLGYFVLQVPACLFFGALLCWVMAHPQSAVRGWDLLGVGIFFIAVFGEARADDQLEQFRSNPNNRGKVLNAGLWRYSRHPNYFFESLYWCAYIPLAVGLPWAWLAVAWPVIMTVSLLWITGVPWAEAQAVATRGEPYRAYQRTTNKFFLWVPRRNG